MSIEKKLNEKKHHSKTSERYLQFDLGLESYAVHLLSVKEVIPRPNTTPLPNSPSFYDGIMNLRGQIISIVDLRKKLNIASKKENIEEAVIIIEIEGVAIGLVVDSINRVLNIEMDTVSEVPEVSSQINAKYIEGVFQAEKSLTILLDLASVLNINEIKNMQSKAA
jgi:purine-binding chemotaxis protein CheW